MSKFKQKPIIVDAIKWEHYEDQFPARCDCLDTGLPHIHMSTGVIAPEIGDWIITSEDGLANPCKPDIFKATYEAVERNEEAEEHPAKVFIWQNKMVMAFDTAGQQMPDWQGQYEDLKDRIDKLPDTVKIERT